MMKSADSERVTLKDIAKRTGYSLISVHRAISGKSGVSEKSREEILAVAHEMGYEINFMASALKRRPLNIAICMPGPRAPVPCYYDYMWKGCRDFIRESTGYHVHTIECPFALSQTEEDEERIQLAALDELYDRWGDRLDGLLTVPLNSSPEIGGRIERFVAKGVRVVLIDNDFPQSGRLCCIAPNDESAGRLSAELMCNIIHQTSGSILVAAGQPTSLSHQMNLRGFADYVRTHRPELNVVAVYDGDQPLDERAYYETMQAPEIIAAYIVRDCATIPICNAALRLEAQRKLLVLGGDLFPQSAEMLRRGVLRGIIDKNSYEKGYRGAKTLLEQVALNKPPRSAKLCVPVSIIMRNNLIFFEEPLDARIP